MAEEDDEEVVTFQVVNPGEDFYDSEPLGIGGESGRLGIWRLVYLGVAPGIMRVGYSEWENQKLRTAFKLELTFSLPTQYFRVKGERFEVERADNEVLIVRHVPSEGATDQRPLRDEQESDPTER